MSKTLEFPRRGTCGENWGESTTSEARERGVCSERATPTSPAPEGEARASPPAPDESPQALPPLSLEEREPPQTQHQVHPETPPASHAPLKGGKKKKKSQGVKLPKKFPRGGRSAEQGEQSLKGDVSSFLCRIVSHCSADHTAQKSQVKSLVHILPLHLAQVGWGSRSNVDRKAPHFLSPTPGHILNSLDII